MGGGEGRQSSLIIDSIQRRMSLSFLPFFETWSNRTNLSGWPSEPQSQTRNRTFNCRFLVKPPDDKNETMEEKQQRISKYESMQICSALLPNADRLESGDVSSESSDIGPCVMCVARRIPMNEKPVGTRVEQFTVKLDTTGKIIAIDVSWLSPAYSKYINKVRGSIVEICRDRILRYYSVRTCVLSRTISYCAG